MISGGGVEQEMVFELDLLTNIDKLLDLIEESTTETGELFLASCDGWRSSFTPGQLKSIFGLVNKVKEEHKKRFHKEDNNRLDTKKPESESHISFKVVRFANPDSKRTEEYNKLADPAYEEEFKQNMQEQVKMLEAYQQKNPAWDHAEKKYNEVMLGEIYGEAHRKKLKSDANVFCSRQIENWNSLNKDKKKIHLDAAIKHLKEENIFVLSLHECIDTNNSADTKPTVFRALLYSHDLPKSMLQFLEIKGSFFLKEMGYKPNSLHYETSVVKFKGDKKIAVEKLKNSTHIGKDDHQATSSSDSKEELEFGIQAGKPEVVENKLDPNEALALKATVEIAKNLSPKAAADFLAQFQREAKLASTVITRSRHYGVPKQDLPLPSSNPNELAENKTETKTFGKKAS